MTNFSDIIVVGAGPAGLSFCREFYGSNLSITLIEKQPLERLENPAYDGREIALTHLSKDIMTRLGIWDKVPSDEIYQLREARVVNGKSPYQLHFPQPEKARGKPTDRLGYLIPNHLIRKASFDVVTSMPNVTLLTETTVSDSTYDGNGISVTLDNGTILSAKLLILADSRFSTMRQKMGIPTDMHNFGRTVIAFRMKHTLSNQHSAFECFHYGRTLAILPLTEHLSNMVVTIDTTKAHTITELSPEELARDIYDQTKGSLGQLELASTIHTYPLVGTHARRFYAPRCALIGDTAVGMHPVTAHGYNLGLESADILSNLILKAHQKNQDIGSQSLLEYYNLKHMMNTRVLYHGTNAIVKLFTTETAPAKLLRSLVLRVSNNLPPVKKLISNQLTS